MLFRSILAQAMITEGLKNVTSGANPIGIRKGMEKAVKVAVRNMADVELNAVNIHVAGIAPDKTPKPALKDLFDEDFLND